MTSSRSSCFFASSSTAGGIPALANQFTKEEILKYVYEDCPGVDNPTRTRPQLETNDQGRTVTLPEFRSMVRSLDEVIDVDYYLPGCPPESDRIWEALVAILEGKLPPKGSVIGAKTTVCDVCERKKTEKKIKGFKRTWQVQPNDTDCLLEQGLVCCGPATRAGCGALCPKVNSPCIGCYGPNDGVNDFGARLMSALSSVIDSDDPAECDRIIQEGIPDAIGTFYRFSLASSLLRGKSMKS